MLTSWQRYEHQVDMTGDAVRVRTVSRRRGRGQRVVALDLKLRGAEQDDGATHITEQQKKAIQRSAMRGGGGHEKLKAF